MLCMAAIGCQALRLLAPRGALEKPLRLILSLFFLLCLLSPLQGEISFEPPRQALEEGARPSMQRLSENYRSLLEQAVGENIEKLIRARLEKMGAEGTNIRINVHAGEDGSIDISEVMITLSEASAGLAEQVKGNLEKEMELPIKVLAGSEVQERWNEKAD